MKLPARFALMVALAVSAGEPALAAAAPEMQRPDAVDEIERCGDWRPGRAFWFPSDNDACALLQLLQQASLAQRF